MLLVIPPICIYFSLIRKKVFKSFIFHSAFLFAISHCEYIANHWFREYSSCTFLDPSCQKVSNLVQIQNWQLRLFFPRKTDRWEMLGQSLVISYSLFCYNHIVVCNDIETVIYILKFCLFEHCNELRPYIY